MSAKKKKSYSLLLLVFLPLFIIGYYFLAQLAQQSMGFIWDDIPIFGTGSMYPTFPDTDGGTIRMMPYPNGIHVFHTYLFGYKLGHRDIVSIDNKKIRTINKNISGMDAGWIKRIIGLPGDILELRVGTVYLNGTPQKEPYTAKPQSTFGESYLGECQKITVPPNQVFVMGDNRKGSVDSREIGFIDIKSINHILPYAKQQGSFDVLWRDTSRDFDKTSQIVLDKQTYLKLLNEKRKNAGVGELTYQSALEISADRRAEIMLHYNDFSTEASMSGYSASKAIKESGYKNIRWGESPVLGYYEAQELLDNQFAFANARTFLLDPDITQIGIANLQGDLHGCPTQIIVQHVVGRVSQQNIQTLIQTWKSTLSDLYTDKRTWTKRKTDESFYSAHAHDVDRIMEIISLRIKNLNEIISRLENYQKLTPKEQTLADQDEILEDEQSKLSEIIVK
jgi:signal peptidase I